MTHTNKQTRTIKFRAWDKSWETMSGDVHWIDWQEERIGYSANTKYGWSDENEPLDSVELMQFTGLLDKNGKEIYEGDWIKCLMRETDVKASVVYSPERGIFGLSLIGVAPFSEFNNLEVIGNIYENGDLLSQTKGGGR